MKAIKILVSFLILLSISCDKHEDHAEKDFEVISPADLKFDLVFPEELWEKILGTAPMTLNTKKSTYDLFEALPIRIELLDSTKKVFSGKNYRFDFKDFGGEIDFENYLNRQSVGHFKMRFEFSELGKESDLHVFFLSWSKQSVKDDDVYGNGCGYFYDVTSYFKKEVLKNGLLLHTNNYRYFDLAAGRLYFVNYTKDKIQLAQITLTDSSLDKRMCPEKL